MLSKSLKGFLIEMLVLFGALWPVFSKNTLPEVISTRMPDTLPAWYLALVLVLLVALVALQIRTLEALRTRNSRPNGLKAPAIDASTPENREGVAGTAPTRQGVITLTAASQTPGRTLVTNQTVDGLLEIWSTKSEHRATEELSRYAGRWFRVQGPVDTISQDRPFLAKSDMTLHWVLRMVLKRGYQSATIYFVFAGASAADFAHVDRGDVVGVEARFSHVNIQGAFFDHAELVTPIDV